MSYDTPGTDDREFIELSVRGVGSVKRTLGDCGLARIELLNGNNHCEVYDKFDVKDVVVPADGYVVICNRSAANPRCDINTGKIGWLQNAGRADTDEISFIDEGGKTVVHGFYGGDGNATCVPSAGAGTVVELEREFNSDDPDQVNLDCGSGFHKVDIADARPATNSCLRPDGGTGTGGTGGGGTGGASTGGASTGGAATGGASTGGAATGGAATGGAATGGASTGGASTGGAATGGASTGGAASGGAAGSATGGSATGGSATGGSATGGSATGGSATGGTSAGGAAGASTGGAATGGAAGTASGGMAGAAGTASGGAATGGNATGGSGNGGSGNGGSGNGGSSGSATTGGAAGAAGAASGGSSGGSDDDSGCGCRTVPEPTSPRSLALFLAPLALLLRRRRR